MPPTQPPGSWKDVTRFVAFLLLITMGVMWGLQFAMLKLAAEEGLSEISIATIALILLSVAFVIILIARGALFRLNAERLMFLIVIGLIGYIFPMLATLYAAPWIPAGILTLIATLAPVVTISIALLLRTEAVSAKRILAVILGSVAVLLILWPEVELPEHGKSLWMVVALIVPICYGVESIYIAAYWPRGLTTLQAVTGETIVATVMIVPVFAFYGAPVDMDIALSLGELAIGIFVLAGVVESLIYFYLIEKTGGVFVSFGTFISLFAGIAWGMVLFSESHGIVVWIAVAALCLSLGLLALDRPTAEHSQD